MASMSQSSIKLCLLGNGGVGKTSLGHRFLKGTFEPDSQQTTIGYGFIIMYGCCRALCNVDSRSAEFLTKEIIVDGKSYNYQVWDTSGQERYRKLSSAYFRDAAAAIIVFDITNETTFNALKDWLTALKEACSPNVVIAIAGNKSDLHVQRQIPTKRAQEYAESLGAIYMETSALLAENVEQIFEEISKRLP
eukprot:Colp12_sorted_trinity150504_noHs@7752